MIDASSRCFEELPEWICSDKHQDNAQITLRRFMNTVKGELWEILRKGTKWNFVPENMPEQFHPEFKKLDWQAKKWQAQFGTQALAPRGKRNSVTRTEKQMQANSDIFFRNLGETKQQKKDGD